MNKEDLQKIWCNIYLSEGTNNSGDIYSDNKGLLGEYEIKDNILEVIIYKSFYDDAFDDVIISESIESNLDDAGLDNKMKINLSFAK